MQFIIIILILGAVWLIAINNIFRKPEYRLPFENLPEEFDGFKIVFLTDLHDRYFFPNNKPLISAVKKERPDVILIGGDMHTKEQHETYLSLIANLCAVAPVCAVNGNHEQNAERNPDFVKYTEQYKQSGVNHLNGTSFTVKRNGKSIRISGADWKNYPEIQPEMTENGFHIFLLHDPLSFDTVKKLPDLMISGHVHGGCLRLPFLGAVFAPGYGATITKRFKRQHFFPKYSLGVYKKAGSRLVVSAGLGNAVVPFRLLRPEITVITLNKPKN